MSQVLFLLIAVATLAYAFVGGVFLAFSDFIMRSLARTGASQGTATMQSVNEEVFRWVFMALFLGMAGASLGLIGFAVVFLSGPAATVIGLAGGIYLIGCFAVTVVCNVPMNEALARMDPGSEATQVYWNEVYVPRWSFWNTVRTMACAMSSALLLVAVMLLAEGRALAQEDQSENIRNAESGFAKSSVQIGPPSDGRACHLSLDKNASKRALSGVSTTTLDG